MAAGPVMRFKVEDEYCHFVFTCRQHEPEIIKSLNSAEASIITIEIVKIIITNPTIAYILLKKSR